MEDVMKPSVGTGSILIILAALFSTLTAAATAQQDFSQGFELIRAGKLKEAADKFERGLKVEPKNAQAHFYLAEAYLGLKQNDKAKAHYQKSLEIDSNGSVAQDTKERLELLSSGGKNLAVGSEFKDCQTCPTMVVIPAGQFIMGSPPTEIGRNDNEGPPHLVNIANSFAVGKFEITFDEWNACVSDCACNPAEDEGWGQGRLPVINVSYDQSVGYTTWLTEKTGKKYRLLSEAEWEYAARAGTNGAYFWGSEPDRACQFANVANPRTKAKYIKRFGDYFDKHPPFNCDDGISETAIVGSFKPNAFGLYDMLGNVLEWVGDCYNTTYAGAPIDGSAWSSGDCSQRLLRGSGWGSTPEFERSAMRNSNLRSYQYFTIGFRVARALP